MFLDASAMIAILTGESDGAELAEKLGRAPQVWTSGIAVYEAVAGLARIGNIPPSQAEGLLDRFLEETGAEVIPITDAISRDALRAFSCFGKGRHPAGLNMGDCFAYACAAALGTALLFKGNDFPLTDIASIGR